MPQSHNPESTSGPEGFPGPHTEEFVIASPLIFLTSYLDSRRRKALTDPAYGPIPPQLTELSGSEAEKEACLSLFVGAILEGEYRQAAGIGLVESLPQAVVDLHDRSAHDIAQRNATLLEGEVTVTDEQVAYGRDLVRSVQDLPPAQSLARAALEALEWGLDSRKTF